MAVVFVPFNADLFDGAGIGGVRRLRAEHVPNAAIPANVYVGGSAAERTDFRDLAASWTPRVFGFVLGLSFILLTIAFRSLVVPIKAIFMNLLSVGAAYGLLVLVFQRGVGAGLFGFQQVEAIETWIPLLLFTVLFGLSMDYHVFLLSRIRERYDQNQNNQESVAFGLRSTAGMITGAALIMVAVFGGFARRRSGHVSADRLRSRGRRPARRDDNQVGINPGQHAAAWQAKLVFPTIPGMAAGRKGGGP